RILRQFVYLDLQLLALEGQDIGKNLKCRFVSQFDFELADNMPIDHELHSLHGRASLDRQMQIALVNGQFASGRSGLFLLVDLHDMIDADMAPAAFAIIDNLDDDDLADQIANIPGVPIKLLTAAGLIIRPGGGARDFAVEQQVDAGFSRILAAADEEVDECSLNLELLR